MLWALAVLFCGEAGPARDAQPEEHAGGRAGSGRDANSHRPNYRAASRQSIPAGLCSEGGSETRGAAKVAFTSIDLAMPLINAPQGPGRSGGYHNYPLGQVIKKLMFGWGYHHISCSVRSWSLHVGHYGRVACSFRFPNFLVSWGVRPPRLGHESAWLRRKRPEDGPNTDRNGTDVGP